MTGRKEELLEYLAGAVGCDCLSDLRHPGLRKKLCAALEKAPPEGFPQSQWTDAAQYLLERTVGGSPDALRAELLEGLGQEEQTPAS